MLRDRFANREQRKRRVSCEAKNKGDSGGAGCRRGADKDQWIWDHLRAGSFLITLSGPVPRSVGQSPGSFGSTPEASGEMRSHKKLNSDNNTPHFCNHVFWHMSTEATVRCWKNSGTSRLLFMEKPEWRMDSMNFPILQFRIVGKPLARAPAKCWGPTCTCYILPLAFLILAFQWTKERGRRRGGKAKAEWIGRVDGEKLAEVTVVMSSQHSLRCLCNAHTMYFKCD